MLIKWFKTMSLNCYRPRIYIQCNTIIFKILIKSCSTFVVLSAGTAVAVLVVLILIVKFCVIEFGINGKSWEADKTAEYIETFVFYFIIGVTVLVVAVPEGLPLAVTLALAYSVRVSYMDRWSENVEV